MAPNNSKDIFTTFEVSKIFEVDITTIINWIDSGKLPAYKTTGGHRRIRFEDLIEFAAKYNLPMKEELILADKKRLPHTVNQTKVLVVEDDVSVVKFISQVVKKTFPDVVIETAFDGFTAGEKLAIFKPDILILDIRLPGVDGFGVLKKVRNRLTNIKVLAITAFPSEETKKKILKSGADDFLAKPFSVEVLKNKLLTLVPQSQS